MKTVAFSALLARREELLDGLAKGETFAVEDGGRKIAALTPAEQDVLLSPAGNAYAMIADLIGIDEEPVEPSSPKKCLATFGLDGPARRAARHLPSSE